MSIEPAEKKEYMHESSAHVVISSTEKTSQVRGRKKEKSISAEAHCYEFQGSAIAVN